MKVSRFFIRAAVGTFQSVRRCVWFVTRPRVRGVSAVALTPEGKVVLVRLTYSRGWHLPGGGQKKSEDARGAVLRELREEIGLSGFSELVEVCAFEHRPDYRRGTGTLFLLRDVEFAAGPSIEIDEIGTFDPEALPADTIALSRRHVAAALEFFSTR